MNDRFKFRYVFEKDFGGKIGICYKMPVFNLDDAVRSVFENEIREYTNFGYKLIAKNQCTGSKDKNGKLIYEGDIVDKGTRCKWIITWFKNRFILVPDFEYKNKDKCASDRECGFKYFENNHSYADKDDEVIGNIYENKDLLNENS